MSSEELCEAFDGYQEVAKIDANSRKRGDIILWVSYIDSLISALLKSYAKNSESMKSLIGSHGPLGSFGSRIDLSHALGLLSDAEKKHLNKLRKIRNFLAHDITTDIESDRIRSWVDSVPIQVFSEDDYKAQPTLRGINEFVEKLSPLEKLRIPLTFAASNLRFRIDGADDLDRANRTSLEDLTNSFPLFWLRNEKEA